MTLDYALLILLSNNAWILFKHNLHNAMNQVIIT